MLEEALFIWVIYTMVLSPAVVVLIWAWWTRLQSVRRRLIRGFLLRTPPDPGSLRPRDAFEFAYLLKKFYELSESQLYEFIRFFTMSIAEYLENYFEDETILAHYSGGSIIGALLRSLRPPPGPL